jgi:hypothetical protein
MKRFPYASNKQALAFGGACFSIYRQVSTYGTLRFPGPIHYY